MAADGTTHVYRLGDWPAPFGIVLVLDRLSALMVLLTSTLALIVLIHAIATGWDARDGISMRSSSSSSWASAARS
jgi:multicomponent K+:H+ antiporter subunit D